MAMIMVMMRVDKMVVNMTKLDNLNKKIINCTKCTDKCVINLPQPGYFCGKILIVLQNPGVPATDVVKNELMQRNNYKQFQDNYKTTIQNCNMGKFINLIFDDWSKISITNVVKCPTVKNTFPTALIIKNCIEYLYKQIDLLEPKLIICVGALSKSVIHDNEEFRHYNVISIPHYSFIQRYNQDIDKYVNKIKQVVNDI